ncbi:MAG: orotidine-5'-phosphate decarboxylase [Candidatus Kapaibacteriota bacterium]
MKIYYKLSEIQKKKNSLLCIGLDPQIEKLPDGISKNILGILNFNKLIIEHTNKFVCAYKMNFAFYEQFGTKGIEVLEKTLETIPDDVVTIADGKRSDIESTSKAYAKAIYQHFGFDCTTLNPFLGLDSLAPFFEYSEKLNFVLVCTSNPGASDFQKLTVNNKFLYEVIAEKFYYSFVPEQLGFVVGATNESEFQRIREIATNNFLLVPGIGAQGGNLDAILNINKNRNIIINVARDIIYASKEKDFIEKVIQRTLFYCNKLQKE